MRSDPALLTQTCGGMKNGLVFVADNCPGGTARNVTFPTVAALGIPDQLTANFLWFYLRTMEGLEKLGEASPGGAGRNRTLGLEALSRIQVPVPDYAKQLWFDNLQQKSSGDEETQIGNRHRTQHPPPSIFSRTFRWGSGKNEVTPILPSKASGLLH